MKTIDVAFLILILSVWFYAFVTPGYQFLPPFWKPEERMNWKPTQLSIVVGFIALIYLVLKK
jgi:hypothetical protein